MFSKNCCKKKNNFVYQLWKCAECNLFSIVIPFLCLSFSFSKSQISGRVLNSKTNLPIYNVSIFIDSSSIGTTTDIDGFFNLKIDKKYVDDEFLNFKMIGYKNLKIPIDLSSENLQLRNIYLDQKILNYEPIQVHSHYETDDLISTISIAGKELNENIKGDLANTLSNESNIGINSIGVVTSKPSLRGFSGDRFLITKDGNQTGDLSQSCIDHVIVLDMSEVDMIDIIRGPESLLYGENAIGGVINTSLIGNPSVKVDRPYGKFLIGDESFNNSDYWNAMLYVPIENTQINTFYSSRQTRNQTSPEGELENTYSNTTNFKLGYTIYNGSNYINFINEEYVMDYGVPPSETGHIDGIDVELTSNSNQINYHRDLSIFHATLDVKYNYIDYEHREYVKGYSDYHVKLQKKTQNMKVELKSHDIILGTEITDRKFQPDGFYLSPFTHEEDISVYGYYNRTIDYFGIDFLSSFRLCALTIEPGEYNHENGNYNLILKDDDGNPILDDNGNKISAVKDREFKNASISLGLRKKIDRFEFNSWFMKTDRAPRVEELYSDGPHLASYAFEVGNPDLKSEKIYGIENSIKYYGNKIDFALVGFYNYSPYYFEMTRDGNCEFPEDWQAWLGHPCAGEDWIDWGSGAAGWLYKYTAKGNEAVIQGIEIDFGYSFTDNFKINYNYSMVRGDNKTTNMPLSYMNPTKEILDISYYKNNYSLKLRFKNIHDQNRLGEFETPTEGALLTDFLVNFQFRRHNIAVQFNNIYDEIHYNHLSRIKDVTPEAGRNTHIVYKIMI